MQPNDCSICNLIQTQDQHSSPIVYSNQEVVIWQNMEVNLPGYFIIAPIRHVTEYTQLNTAEAANLFQITQKTLALLQQKYNARKIYQCCFSELTPHIHFHLFPRYDWMDDIKKIHINGSIDGIKLFSFIRQKYLVNDDPKIKASLLEFIDDFKKHFHFK